MGLIENRFTKHLRIGSIVMNCNPFTLGHQYLIETAIKSCDYLYIFVVEEDKSIFSLSSISFCSGMSGISSIIPFCLK